MELLHTDVCGPVDHLSYDRKLYFVTLLDDYSGMAAVVPISNKSDVETVLPILIESMETASGKKAQAIRSDRGGEFTGNSLGNYFRSRMIKHQLTAPYSPQQNGKAERLNRTLVNRIRALLLDAQLPKTLWTEALRTANYLRNRVSPSARDDTKTPYELFTGQKPDISHLRVFGCTAYAADPTHKRKLDERGTKGTFVGYDTNSLAYRIWVPPKGILIRRDVRFIESGVCTLQTSQLQGKPAPVYVEISRGNVQPQGAAAAGVPQAAQPQVQAPAGAAAPIPAPAAVVPPQPAVRVSGRVRNPPQRYEPQDFKRTRLHLTTFDDVYMCFMALMNDDPQTVEEALSRSDSDQWLQAMNEELKSFAETGTYEVVDADPSYRPIPLKWVLKRKRDEAGRVTRYRARLVAKGYRQIAGLDFHELYAPVCRAASIRTLLTHAAVNNLEIEQLDIKTAFLYGDLKEDIYTELPPGFQTEAGKLWKLKKSLYGLKQAPRMWYEKLSSELVKVKFKGSLAEPGLFIKQVSEAEKVYLAMHVDDLLIVGSSEQVRATKEDLAMVFKIHDLGAVKFYLGMQISRDRDKRLIMLSQQAYVNTVLQRFNMSDAHPKLVPFAPGTVLVKRDENEDQADVPYMELLGSLLYMSVWTRPDISFHVSCLAKYMSSPTMHHWKTGMNILRYLVYTMSYVLCLGAVSQSAQPIVYVDSDYASDLSSRKSTTGFVLQWYGSSIHWSSKLQDSVAVSTAEAEYIALSSAVKEALWLKNLMVDFGMSAPILVLNDNSAVLSIANNPMCAKRAKHIDTQLHHIRDRIAKGEIIVQYCATNQMLADILTKPLPAQKHGLFTEQLGVKNQS